MAKYATESNFTMNCCSSLHWNNDPPSVCCVFGGSGMQTKRPSSWHRFSPTPGSSTGHNYTLLYSRCPRWRLAAAASCCSAPPRTASEAKPLAPPSSHHFVWLQVVLFVQVVQDGQLLLHGGQVDPQVPVHASGEASLQLVALSRHQGGAEALVGRSSSQCQLAKHDHRETKRAVYTMLEGKSTEVREKNTYSKHSSHDPSMVLSEGLSIRVVWMGKPRAVSPYPDLLGHVFMSSCLLSAPWMSCCPALTSERNSLRNLRPRRSHSRASVAELRTWATSIWTSCSTMDCSVGKLSGSDISFWWIFYTRETHYGLWLKNVNNPGSKLSVKSWWQIRFYDGGTWLIKKIHTYLDISNKIHFNWCKHCGSQLV